MILKNPFKTVGLAILFILSIVVLLLLAAYLSLSVRDKGLLFSSAITINVNGSERAYFESPARESPTRLIIGLHGFSDTPKRFAYYTGLHNAASDSTTVVYPEASTPKDNQKTGWNSSFCCGSGFLNDIDDSTFLSTLITELSDKYGLSSEQVFIAGFSNGAFMAQRMAAEHPEQIKAVASVAGTIGTEKTQLKPTQSVPIFLQHGKNDNRVPFGGGASHNDEDFVFKSHDHTRKVWEAVNGKSSAPVEVTIHEDDGHVWHDWRILKIWHTQPAASKEIIDFFDSL